LPRKWSNPLKEGDWPRSPSKFERFVGKYVREGRHKKGWELCGKRRIVERNFIKISGPPEFYSKQREKEVILSNTHETQRQVIQDHNCRQKKGGKNM